LIAVEEASTGLNDRSPGAEGRVRRVMGFAERTLHDTTLSEAERITLRGYLNWHLSLFKSYRPRAAIQMLYRHHLWDADHLPYILSQVDDFLGRQLVYRALIDLRAKLNPEQVAQLVHRLRANPPLALERLAMLDEFDHLDQMQYAILIKRLQMSFCAVDRGGGFYRLVGREIRLRALDRIQTRLQRRDPATVWAVRKAAGQPGGVLGATFFRRLEAADFRIELSPEAFAAADPLGLTTTPSSNVVPFQCAARLGPSQ
jgi:hypothetical protein